ncbi:TIR domain-containing protein [Micromonospora sp. NPDC050417]|uniref:TIR domain-containing protein n=1 Tax=Micromonospora sp. NPDC050417 TaxID=3364280 RepID=UPI0037981D43
MPYHVQVSSGLTRSAVLHNLSSDDLTDRILEPWWVRGSIVVGGKVFNLADRVDVSIFMGPEINLSEAGFGSAAWLRILQDGQNVTDEFIKAPPGVYPSSEGSFGGKSRTAYSPSGNEIESKPDDRVVGVVYGRNVKANKALFAFLRSLDLKPLEWDHLVSKTGSSTPYVGHVVEQIFRQVRAVIVLFTPDDLAYLRLECRASEEPVHETELTGQPRPNVLFEAGMAFGLHPSRTILVQVGRVRPISDLEGRNLVRFDGTASPLRRLAQRLKDAGCCVDETGGDWLDASNFPGLDPSGNPAVLDRPA